MKEVAISMVAAAPFLIYLQTRRGPLQQLVYALNCLRVLACAVSLAARDLWRDRGYYWRRAVTVLSEWE